MMKFNLRAQLGSGELAAQEPPLQIFSILPLASYPSLHTYVAFDPSVSPVVDTSALATIGGDVHSINTFQREKNYK